MNFAREKKKITHNFFFNVVKIKHDETDFHRQIKRKIGEKKNDGKKLVPYFSIREKKKKKIYISFIYSGQ